MGQKEPQEEQADPWPAATDPASGALAGVRVLDCTSLVPGPLATLLLADAGADVLKVERPGVGDELRHQPPRLGTTGASFALLNRGKRSVDLDLKEPADRRRFLALAEHADVLVEQFRPGVMAALGLGWETLRAVNDRLVYCSITGYGQTGPKQRRAGHDLTYLAETGLLGLAADSDGRPGVPPALIADIAGGAYPAVMNILLALRQRDLTGRGCHLDVAMTDNLFPLMFWALGSGFAGGHWPRPGGELLTGGSPRYRVYETADGRYLAAAPLEQRFWEAFCAAVDLPVQWRDDAADPEGTARAVGERIAARTAAQWAERLEGLDVCAAVVATLEEAVADAQVRARHLFDRTVEDGTASMPALPLPWAPEVRTR